jgi:hypothetical protein
LWPEEPREELPRSCFFGAAIFADLLAEEGCAGIRFHFGYDAGRERLPLRYAAVLEAVDGVGRSLELFADHGSLCPPNCPPDGPVGPGVLALAGRFIGSFIDKAYYQRLIDGYARMFPTEQRSVFIRREYIMAAMAESPRVCGIRFTYGQKEGDDPRSRIVLLMSCYETRNGNGVPKTLFTHRGHLTDAGDRVSSAECRELFDRHVNRMCVLLPLEPRQEMPRGCFFGIERLRELLATEGCVGARYHFGYDENAESLADKYAPVMEAVDSRGRGLEMFLETGQHCPPTCPPGGPGGTGLVL